MENIVFPSNRILVWNRIEIDFVFVVIYRGGACIPFAVWIFSSKFNSDTAKKRNHASQQTHFVPAIEFTGECVSTQMNRERERERENVKEIAGERERV